MFENEEVLFEGIPSLADFMILKSMSQEELDKAGVDLELVAKSITEDLLKGCTDDISKDTDIEKSVDEEEDDEEEIEKSEDEGADEEENEEDEV